MKQLLLVFSTWHSSGQRLGSSSIKVFVLRVCKSLCWATWCVTSETWWECGVGRSPFLEAEGSSFIGSDLQIKVNKAAKVDQSLFIRAFLDLFSFRSCVNTHPLYNLRKGNHWGRGFATLVQTTNHRANGRMQTTMAYYGLCVCCKNSLCEKGFFFW